MRLVFDYSTLVLASIALIAWEAPLMGWRFVLARVIPSLAFPVLAGWLVGVFFHD